MTAKIKQFESEGPECALCKVTVKHDGFYLSLEHECSAGEESEIVICDDCMRAWNDKLHWAKDDDSRNVLCKKCHLYVIPVEGCEFIICPACETILKTTPVDIV